MMKKRILAAILAAGLMGTGSMPTAVLAAQEPAEVSLLEEKYGLEELSKAMETKPWEMNMDFRVLITDGDDKEEVTAGYNAAYDWEKKKMRFGMSLYSSENPEDENIDLDLYLDDEQLQGYLSMLSDSVYVLDYGSGMATSLLSSPVLAGLGIGLDGERADLIAGSVQDLLGMLFIPPQAAEDTGETIIEELMKLNEEKSLVEVTGLPDKEFAINGAATTCSGYSFTLTTDTITQFANAYSAAHMSELPMDLIGQAAYDVMKIAYGLVPEEVGTLPSEEEFQTFMAQLQTQLLNEALFNSDVITGSVSGQSGEIGGELSGMDVEAYLTPENELAGVNVKAVLEADNEQTGEKETADLELGLEMLGDQMEMTLNVTDGDETVGVVLKSKDTQDGDKLLSDTNVEITADGETMKVYVRETLDTATNELRADGNISMDGMTVPLTMTGSILQEAKGEYLEIVIDELKLTEPEGEESIIVSGSYGFGPLKNEITELEGEKLNVLSTDMMTLMMSLKEVQAEMSAQSSTEQP